jgi:hypothetical protein
MSSGNYTKFIKSTTDNIFIFANNIFNINFATYIGACNIYFIFNFIIAN